SRITSTTTGWTASAGWVPAEDARADAESAISLKKAAAICERPELWTHAKMTLSTATRVAADTSRIQGTHERADEMTTAVGVFVIDPPHVELDVDESCGGQL